MREIKFRAKTKYNGDHYDAGEWVCGNYIFVYREIDHLTNERVVKHYIKESLDEFDYEYEIDETTLGQYTGIKDRNGVEIYEGDIVDDDWYSSSYGSGVVSWNGDAFYQVEYKQKTNYSRELLGNIVENDIEVVGNIHDKENKK